MLSLFILIAHATKMVTLRRSRRDIFVVASLGVSSLPLVKKTSLEVRPTACVIVRVAELRYVGGRAHPVTLRCVRRTPIALEKIKIKTKL